MRCKLLLLVTRAHRCELYFEKVKGAERHKKYVDVMKVAVREILNEFTNFTYTLRGSLDKVITFYDLNLRAAK